MSARLRKASPDAVVSAPAVRNAIAAAEAARRFSLEPGPIAKSETRRGRGAAINPRARFERLEQRRRRRRLGRSTRSCRRSRPRWPIERPRTIIARNHSPDISFDRSINPYRGCEHGCIYCFARPTPRLSRPLARPRLRDQAVRQARRRRSCWREELATPRLPPRRPIAIGTNTDPYQPIEKQLRITREILEVLARVRPSGRRSSPSRRWSQRDIDILARDGATRPRQGGAVGDDARPQARPRAWSRARRRRPRGSRRSAGSPRPASRRRCWSRR